MRNVCVAVAAIIAVASTSSLSAGAGAIRISQVYPGGGGTTIYPQTYLSDYVELFNASGSPVDVGGWILAHGGPTDTPNYGCAGCTWQIPLDTTVAPCGYLLIKIGPPNPLGTAPDVPSPDIVLSGTDFRSVMGTLGLFSQGTPAGICPTYARVDLVAWDSQCNETHSAVGPNSYTDLERALVRFANGMTDTDNNRADFELVSDPQPRNSSTPQDPGCLQTPVSNSTWGRLKAICR